MPDHSIFAHTATAVYTIVFYVSNAVDSQMKYASARQKFIVLAKTGIRMILAFPDARLHENNN